MRRVHRRPVRARACATYLPRPRPRSTAGTGLSAIDRMATATIRLWVLWLIAPRDTPTPARTKENSPICGRDAARRPDLERVTLARRGDHEGGRPSGSQDDAEGGQHRQRLAHKYPWIEQHADRDEEQDGEGVPQGQRPLGGVVAQRRAVPAPGRRRRRPGRRRPRTRHRPARRCPGRSTAPPACRARATAYGQCAPAARAGPCRRR